MKKLGKVQLRALWSLGALCLALLGFGLLSWADSRPYVVVTASPAEIWVQPGQSFSVTFIGTIKGDVFSEQWYSAPDYVAIAGNTITLTYQAPNTDGDYSVSQGLAAQYQYRVDGQTGGGGGSGGARCLVHVRSKPMTTPTPMGTPSPTASPNPTPTYPPNPSPTTPPNPTPTIPPGPNPTPTSSSSGSWSPLEKEIGYHRVGESWQADGCMTAPVDQSADCAENPAPTATPLPVPTLAPPTPRHPIDPPGSVPVPTSAPAPGPTEGGPTEGSPTEGSPTEGGPTEGGPTEGPRGAIPPTGAPATPLEPGLPPGVMPQSSAPALAPSAPAMLSAPAPTPAPTAPSKDKVVLPGAEVPCAVQSAQDFDTYTSSSRDGIQTKSYAADGPLTYRWSASAGHFKDDAETGQNVTWVAPDDLSEATSVIIKCIIDDPDGPRVSAPDTGSHDDNATVRMATVKVVPKVIYLTGSKPDFVVYRNPTDPTPTPMPIESEVVSTSTASDFAGGSVDSGVIEGDLPNEQDADVPDDNPDDWIPQDQEFIQDAPPESGEPIISFGLHVSGFPKWKAKVSVYEMGEDSGSLAAPLASTEITGDSDESNPDKLQVKWSQLFPGLKPPTGLYFYNVEVEGVIVPGKSFLDEKFFGVQDDRNSREAQRLETDMSISELSWQVVDDDENLLPFAAIAGPGGIGQTSEEGIWPKVEITFRLSGANTPSSLPTLWLIDPEFEREQALGVERLPDGRYKAVWTAKAETLKQMGEYLLTADGKGKTPVKKPVPAFKRANNSVTVDGFALGYEMMSHAHQPIANATLRRYAEAGSWNTFRAFVKVTQKIKGANGTSWFSDKPVSNATLNNFEWISENVPGRMPRDVKTAAKDWSGNPRSLGLRVTWREFSNEVIKQEKPGVDRWYGLRAQKVASGWSYPWQVSTGVTWWGARIDYNKKGQPRVWQLPTDRKEGKLDFPLSEERTTRLYAQPNFTQIDPYYGEKQRRLWWPDPSGRDTKKWQGRVVGQGRIDVPIFDSADKNAPAGQGALNAKIMHFATGFINTPYGWGGQTYGGQQSRTATEFTRGSGNAYTDKNGAKLGDSRRVSSYGIDCSGFVTEAAYLAGITGIPSAWGYTAGDLMSASQAVDVDSFNYLRPGDFVAWSKHTFYVAATPIGTGAATRVRTLEAQPDVVGTELGRTRYSWRNKSALDEVEAEWRRWGTP